MFKRILKFIVLIGVFLFSGCASSVNNISKNESYKRLDEVAVIGRQKELVITNSTLKYEPKPQEEKCKQQSRLIINQILNVSDFVDHLKARDIKINYFTDKESPKRLLIIQPIKYSSFGFECSYVSSVVQISLYEIENIPRDNLMEQDKINVEKMIKNLTDKNLIYRENFYLDSKFNTYKSIMEREIAFWGNSAVTNERNIDVFFKRVIDELAKVMIFPSATIKTLETIRKEKELSLLECKFQNNEFNLGYKKANNVLCIDKIGLSDAKVNNTMSRLEVLNANSGKTDYLLKNSSCNNLSVTYAHGSKNDKMVAFDKTYKTQILEFYNNQCTINQFGEVNLMDCTKDKEHEYFLENSKIYENRIYEKNLVQMDKLCFSQFKKVYENESSDKLWQTKHGYNELGWNSFGDNKITNLKYDQDGYDAAGWNKEGIHKQTKTIYAPNGFNKQGVHEDGTDKDGWNPKLKKFVNSKRNDNNIFYFNPRDFKTESNNSLLNASNYDKVSYLKENDGFKLVAEKHYKKDNKLIAIEKYFFKSTDAPLLDINNPNKSINKSIILERTEKIDIK